MNASASEGRVAFLGLGAMGREMAGVLLRAGVSVTVWNRSAGAAQSLAADGASLALSPAAAVSDADTVISMVSDVAALDAVMLGTDGAMHAMAAGTLHICMSTIGAEDAQNYLMRHGELEQAFVAAPVFGRPQAAADALLFIVAAGDSTALARAEPLFSLLGQRTFIVGDKPAQASAMKLAGNFMIMAAAEAMGEAMAVASKAGVDAATVKDVLTGSIFNAPIYHTYGAMLVERRFSPPGFTAELGLKDLRLFDALADKGRVPAPLIGILLDRLRAVISRHGPDTDWAAVGAIAMEDAEHQT
jgi:3-hydroxyisobutyrate dehydrogenase-like beta-hydroxyacid dehydrogenase